ncbi:MAG: 50S ribosome-binding GTPase [Candidatus Omnitrophica bacterium]|nr:50S ribosome-binding GTPase [Candidatus Omnitrophota bacterium]
MIVDKIKILFKSGDGGRGSNSVKKISSAKFLPDGGDGGRGGDIVLKVSPHLYDLTKLKGKKKITAPSGEPGTRRSKSGKNAEPLFIDLPKGTQVLDEGKKLLVDLSKEGQQFKLCAGGFGGRGNARKPATTDPKEGQAKLVTLDYRIPADVSILGLANSQKTTLFNLLTGQKNKVAHYPFTTAVCALGHFSYDFKKITLLDTPPVRKTKGSLGKNRFLRHLFRAKIIVVLGSNDGFKQVKEEIYKFKPKILDEKKVFYLPENIDRININQLKKKLYNYLEK